MAKVIFDSDIQALSGKLHRSKNASYAYNKKTGKCYRYEYNTDTKHTNTTDQQAVKTTFTAKSKATKAWWATNKPADDATTFTEEWTAMMKAYDAQHKYGNPYVFVRSKVTDDNTVSFLSTTSDDDDDTDAGSDAGGSSKPNTELGE